MSETLRTPLHAVHEELGAVFTDFAGWRMPLRYGSETAEHQAVRQAAGMFDLSHMGEIVVRGPQAGAALDYALVGHLSVVGVGRARYTMICTESGGVLDDLVVYRTGEQEYLVVANAANVAVVARELTERARGFDAEVRDASAEYALIAVQGPRAAALLAGLTDVDLDKVRYYACVEAKVGKWPALLARTGYTGEDGFELFLAPDDAEPVWRAVAGAGEAHGLRPAGLACRDTLRLEAGMPLYGNELRADLTPYEAGLGRVVKFDHGDFVGRAALAARAESGPRISLIGLVATGRRSPRKGYPVIDPRSDRPIGTVTSGAPSPTLGKPIAMAYVPNDQAEPGTRLCVEVRGSLEPVDVVTLPFYRARDRRR
ncbi:glycine cleavage system protein T [Carbonactinospora thermoautotrophica]|uniref:glycine cleavage system aminomethyltransferase GcvT n=1 Tax=Carbonactinospora thermoautotrophica TaxID=1469144 RepID=UPI00226F64F6|nr:glycine cleavage system aminomethyltransferase GcvT [Carbonactinospora thermoautotrophica]MCX9193844.1 glycine cleavage system protein T [Carbonactinospora thermoautotrophica]